MYYLQSINFLKFSQFVFWIPYPPSAKCSQWFQIWTLCCHIIVLESFTYWKHHVIDISYCSVCGVSTYWYLSTVLFIFKDSEKHLQTITFSEPLLILPFVYFEWKLLFSGLFTQQISFKLSQNYFLDRIIHVLKASYNWCVFLHSVMCLECPHIDIYPLFHSFLRTQKSIFKQLHIQHHFKFYPLYITQQIPSELSFHQKSELESFTYWKHHIIEMFFFIL